jgi:predicted transcriptional regulator
MTTQSLFDDEETKLLIRTAVSSGYAVAVVKWSGRTGSLAEMEVIAKAFVDAARKHTTGRLNEVLTSDDIKRRLTELAGQFHIDRDAAVHDAQTFARRRCAELDEMLSGKVTPEEADTVKQTIVAMSLRIAEESKEGDFLGFGGTRVSPEEVMVINELARALKTTPPA